MCSVPPEKVWTTPSVDGDRVLEFHLLGCRDWEEVWTLQRRLVYEAAGQCRPRITVLCCEHPELITIGRCGSRGHVRWTDEQLRRERLNLRWVGRGGGCVLHAPGQLCLYPIVPLPLVGWTVGEYLSRLQRGLTKALAECGVQPILRPGQYGLWGRSGLLAAVGVAVQNWVTCHGAFVNVNPAMARFAYVDATAEEREGNGAKGTQSSLFAERRLPVRMTSVRAALVPSFADSFSCCRYHVHSGHPLLPQRTEASRESIARAS